MATESPGPVAIFNNFDQSFANNGLRQGQRELAGLPFNREPALSSTFYVPRTRTGRSFLCCQAHR